MLKPLKAAPYGFLHHMEVLFMGELTTTEKTAGRPTKFTQRRAEAIINLLLEGYSLMRIGTMPGMPDVSTIRRWRIEFPMFDDAVRRAVAIVEEDDYAQAIELANSIGPDSDKAAIELQMKAYWARAKRHQLGPRVAVTTIQSTTATAAQVEKNAERDWSEKTPAEYTLEDIAKARSDALADGIITGQSVEYLEDAEYNWRYYVNDGQFLRQRITAPRYPEGTDRDAVGYIERLK